MGRTATINKDDVTTARDVLRASGKPHGIIAIRKHLGRGSPGLIGRLLGDGDRMRSRNFSQTSGSSVANIAAPGLAAREQENAALHRAMRSLEQRVAAAEAKYTLISAAVIEKEQEIVRQREMFENWRADLLRSRALLANSTDQLTVTIAGPARPPAAPAKSSTGEQLDLYGADSDT